MPTLSPAREFIKSCSPFFTTSILFGCISTAPILEETSIAIMMSMPDASFTNGMGLPCGLASAITRSAIPAKSKTYFNATSL
ncbi:MAG: hypothetical protein BWY84_01096 [Candidatus Aerophobetes bacterium ADurb.Bin490]|nr:MAG: hypothetical protein BWY84_01096 [Candidatus Aerophobetes bacterium ADurb.Bin490]